MELYFVDLEGFINEKDEVESNLILKEYGLEFTHPGFGDGGEEFFNCLDLWLPYIKDLAEAFILSGAYDVIKAAILKPIKNRRDLKHPGTEISFKFGNGDTFSIKDPSPEQLDAFYDKVLDFEKSKYEIENGDN